MLTPELSILGSNLTPPAADMSNGDETEGGRGAKPKTMDAGSADFP